MNLKYNVFDVVELNSGTKATIIGIEKGLYRGEEVNQNGTRKGIISITENEISSVIWKKD